MLGQCWLEIYYERSITTAVDVTWTNRGFYSADRPQQKHRRISGGDTNQTPKIKPVYYWRDLYRIGTCAVQMSEGKINNTITVNRGIAALGEMKIWIPKLKQLDGQAPDIYALLLDIHRNHWIVDNSQRWLLAQWPPSTTLSGKQYKHRFIFKLMYKRC